MRRGIQHRGSRLAVTRRQRIAAAKELLVELDLLLLLEAEADVSSEERLLALACCALFSLVLKLALALLFVALSSVDDLLSVVL